MSSKNHNTGVNDLSVCTVSKSLALIEYDEEKEDTYWNSQGDEQRVALCKCMGEERRQTGRNVMADSGTIRERRRSLGH